MYLDKDLIKIFKPNLYKVDKLWIEVFGGKIEVNLGMEKSPQKVESYPEWDGDSPTLIGDGKGTRYKN